MKKRIFFSILTITIVSFLLFNIDLLKYGIMQGKGQLNVLLNARPVEEVMADINFPDSLKSKIELMQEVRQFAIDSLGLKDTENYTAIFDQQGKDILWNLSACEPYKLKSVQWSFPFLGKFSYKGFFDLDKAKEERKLLNDKGYDTRIRPVSAWSTLGWFRDPILSNQLSRSDGSLAELVIHELTHATIFIKDSLSFNENLASFIGEKGAIKFLEYRYGTESVNLNNYKNSENDYIRYTNHMLEGTKQLNDLYGSFDESMTDAEKERSKMAMIRQIVTKVDTISFHNPERFRGIHSRDLPNNCYFLSFTRYFSKIDQLELELENNFGGNLRAFIKYQNENQ